MCGCDCDCEGAAAEAADAAAVLAVMTTVRDAGAVLLVAVVAVAADAANNEVAPSGMLAINWARFCVWGAGGGAVEKGMILTENNGSKMDLM